MSSSSFCNSTIQAQFPSEMAAPESLQNSQLVVEVNTSSPEVTDSKAMTPVSSEIHCEEKTNHIENRRMAMSEATSCPVPQAPRHKPFAIPSSDEPLIKFKLVRSLYDISDLGLAQSVEMVQSGVPAYKLPQKGLHLFHRRNVWIDQNKLWWARNRVDPLGKKSCISLSDIQSIQYTKPSHISLVWRCIQGCRAAGRRLATSKTLITIITPERRIVFHFLTWPICRAFLAVLYAISGYPILEGDHAIGRKSC